MNSIETAQKYFKASNRSDFSEIEKFFTESSTYSSQNTGLYLGKEDILNMQRQFHGSFDSVHWEIQEIQEENPGIIRIDFEFEGLKNGEKIVFSGVEYVVVKDNIIQHIEIRKI